MNQSERKNGMKTKTCNFKSGGHPFRIELAEGEKKIFLSSRVPIRSPDYLFDRIEFDIGDGHGARKYSLNEGEMSWCSKFRKDLSMRFPWLGRDTFIAIEEMLNDEFLSPNNSNHYLKPFWQRVGPGILIWLNAYSGGDKHCQCLVYKEPHEYWPITEDEQTKETFPDLTLHCHIVKDIVKTDFLFAGKARWAEVCNLIYLLPLKRKRKKFERIEHQSMQSWHREDKWKVLKFLESLEYG